MTLTWTRTPHGSYRSVGDFRFELEREWRRKGGEQWIVYDSRYPLPGGRSGSRTLREAKAFAERRANTNLEA